MLTISHYWPLVLLLALPFLWKMRSASAVQLSVTQIKSLAVVRSVVLVLLVLALMRPIWNRSGTWVSVVFALDVSQSISPEFLKSALDWLEEATEEEPSARHRYIAFAEQAKVVESIEELRALPVSKNRAGDVSTSAVRQGSTHIERAMTTALQAFSPHSLRRLVLVTDGRETHGDVMRGLWRAQREGVRVFTVPADARSEGDVWIENIGTSDEFEIRRARRVRGQHSQPIAVGWGSRVDNGQPGHTAQRSIGPFGGRQEPRRRSHPCGRRGIGSTRGDVRCKRPKLRWPGHSSLGRTSSTGPSRRGKLRACAFLGGSARRRRNEGGYARGGAPS